MKFLISLALIAALCALAGMYVSFTIHLTYEMGRLGWELVSEIF